MVEEKRDSAKEQDKPKPQKHTPNKDTEITNYTDKLEKLSRSSSENTVEITLSNSQNSMDHKSETTTEITRVPVDKATEITRVSAEKATEIRVSSEKGMEIIKAPSVETIVSRSSTEEDRTCIEVTNLDVKRFSRTSSLDSDEKKNAVEIRPISVSNIFN